jgi:hypothetical protein
VRVLYGERSMTKKRKTMEAADIISGGMDEFQKFFDF